MNRAINQEKMQKEAKQLLNKFVSSLEKVEKLNELDFYVERTEFERQEKNKKNHDESFKERILENAPNKDDDFIIVEKGSWK